MGNDAPNNLFQQAGYSDPPLNLSLITLSNGNYKISVFDGHQISRCYREILL
jgi:hypothetical protein